MFDRPTISLETENAMAYAVVIPGQFSDSRSRSHVYVRRRMMVILCLAAIVLVLIFGAGRVVANRGGAPASASMIRPATAPAVVAPAPANVYIVKAGDTLWSIGERYHGQASLVDYVDALVSANGGTELQVSQALTVP
jgi:LysM repeat protein